MAVRFEDIARIALVSSFVLLACTANDAGNQGAGGAGSSAGGMAAGAGTSSGGGGNPSSAGSGTAGSSSAGTATGGGSGGGGASSSAGNSAGGSGGNSAGGGGGSGAGGSGGSGAGTGGSSAGSGGAGGKSKTTFFVTSDTSKTGKLGGLDGADKRCQDLATKAGFGDHTFHAYLSTAAVNAKDRIGTGPWVNSKGLTVAPDLATLHSAATKGDHTLFIDENGMPIHGQWDSSATVEHDVLTGSMPDGTVQTGMTCMDWTSDAMADKAQVGHSDGEGPGMATTGTYTSWNSAHANGGCNDTAPLGGAGRLYCFAIN